MKRKDILMRLEERLARGEISEKTYLDIKARYEAEPEEPEAPAAPEPDLQDSIHQAVQQASAESMRAVNESMRVMRDSMREVHDSVRSMDFSGMGVRISDEEIRIVGAGVVTGSPVRTTDFRVSGSAQIHGSLECEDARIAGSCDIDGDVKCTDLRSSGSTRVAGSLRAADVEVSGSLDVAKDVEATDITASGSLRVAGDVHAQDFRSSGSIRVAGTMKVSDVDIELGGSSKVGAIEAHDVRIRMGGGFVRARGDLTADRIVGNDVLIEGTTAALVQGSDVRIGPHCRVEKVIAHELVVHESSEVKQREVPSA
jgi:cytoskeletal protein CcmA (bactofilin family)